jgi:hypothetical protein
MYDISKEHRRRRHAATILGSPTSASGARQTIISTALERKKANIISLTTITPSLEEMRIIAAEMKPRGWKQPRW